MMPDDPFISLSVDMQSMGQRGYEFFPKMKRRKIERQLAEMWGVRDTIRAIARRFGVELTESLESGSYAIDIYHSADRFVGVLGAMVEADTFSSSLDVLISIPDSILDAVCETVERFKPYIQVTTYDRDGLEVISNVDWTTTPPTLSRWEI